MKTNGAKTNKLICILYLCSHYVKTKFKATNINSSMGVTLRKVHHTWFESNVTIKLLCSGKL